MDRIHWNRFAGRPLPPNTKLVSRPTKYGNPYNLRDYDRKTALRLFAEYLDGVLKNDPTFLDELRGHDLACSCKLEEECHADIIIRRIENI